MLFTNIHFHGLDENQYISDAAAPPRLLALGDNDMLAREFHGAAETYLSAASQANHNRKLAELGFMGDIEELLPEADESLLLEVEARIKHAGALEEVRRYTASMHVIWDIQNMIERGELDRTEIPKTVLPIMEAIEAREAREQGVANQIGFRM